MTTCNDIINELKALGNEEKRRVLQGFFKTGEGQYGYGDKFMGIPVPLSRGVAKKHKAASVATVEDLLRSEWHEARLCALLIMVEKARRGDEETRRQMFELYLASTGRINNWDLVDLSAPQIVGEWLMQGPRDVLYTLADSPLLWDNRVAIVATYAFIKNGDLDDTYRLATRLMDHPHELIHKAVGWMLREAGKKDMPRLMAFVDKHYASMPRTMLRYAIEKYPEDMRKEVLKRK